MSQQTASTAAMTSQDRQRTYKRIIEARSCNQIRIGRAIRIAYFECVLVALRIQHIMRMNHTAICGVSGCVISFHIT